MDLGLLGSLFIEELFFSLFLLRDVPLLSPLVVSKSVKLPPWLRVLVSYSSALRRGICECLVSWLELTSLLCLASLMSLSSCLCRFSACSSKSLSFLKASDEQHGI